MLSRLRTWNSTPRHRIAFIDNADRVRSSLRTPPLPKVLFKSQISSPVLPRYGPHAFLRAIDGTQKDFGLVAHDVHSHRSRDGKNRDSATAISTSTRVLKHFRGTFSLQDLQSQDPNSRHMRRHRASTLCSREVRHAEPRSSGRSQACTH